MKKEKGKGMVAELSVLSARRRVGEKGMRLDGIRKWKSEVLMSS